MENDDDDDEDDDDNDNEDDDDEMVNGKWVNGKCEMGLRLRLSTYWSARNARWDSPFSPFYLFNFSPFHLFTF